MESKNLKPKPGELIPWEQKEKEIGKLTGDKDLIKSQWDKIEELANRFIWAVLTDF